MHVTKPRTFGSITAAAMIWALSSGAAGAADLGGNCCADLEERVAELEATTARKGNRKVSLTVSGHVHEAAMFFDVDGKGDDKDAVGKATESNVYIGTHNSSRSRFRFRGDAQINADWSAGFFMEIGMRRVALNSTSQSSPGPSGDLDIRHEALYVKSKTLGTFWFGWTGSAIEGITEICVGCVLGNGTPDYSVYVGNLFAGNGERFRVHGTASGFFPGEGDRRNMIKWISPSLAGFSVSASWGGDDFWDAALRYAGEFGSIRLAGGIGYSLDTDSIDPAGISAIGCSGSKAGSDRACSTLGGSASMMHVPTGLYVRGSYGQNTDENVTGDQDKDIGWEVTAGIDAKINSLGKTNFWGAYGVTERKIGLDAGQTGELTMWGVGINQKIDAAAMDVYIWYRNYSAELVNQDTGDATVITAGARIRF